MPRSSKSFGGSMRDSASAMKEVIATAKELYDSISDDESKTQEYQNTIDNLNDDISRLNAEIFALERRIKASGDIELFENLKQQAATASYQFTQFAETLGLSLNSVADDGKTTIDTISKNIKKGETTYLQAVQNVKGGFTKLLREQQSVDFDASMVQRFTSAFDELAKSVKALTQKIIELVESTPKALEGLNNIDGDDASVSVKKIADATKELTVGASEAYEPLTNLVTALTELGKVDEYSLSNISAIFRNLSSVGEGTFGDQKIKQIKQLISVVQEATGNSTGRLSIDLSGLDGLKGLDKRNVEKITNVGEAIKGISALLGDSSTLSSNVDQIIKLFQVDPSSGINNLKVSKASLSNLQTFLPEIAKVKIDNIQKLFSIDTSGINSLKVSKPSIQNVVNLARAAQILKENNVDLTLKGDPSEELNKIAQKMSLIGDAAETAADAVNDLSGALGSRDLEPTEPEGYSPLNGKDLAGSVKSALRLQEVPAENIKEVTKAVAGMRGEFVSATAAWRDYGEEGRHVTSVVVQTATEAENGIQKLTSQVVEFKRNVNEETGEVTWTSKLASGIEKIKAVADSAAQSTDKLIKQNDALSLTKLDDLRLNAEKSIQSALRSGVGDDNDSIDALRTLQSVLGDVESELRNADYSQSAFNEITKEASALIGVHSKQLGFAVQQQKEEAAATREAEKAKAALVDRTKAQAAVEAELNKVIGPLYGDAIKNGISESDPGMQQLQAYASELYALYDWMQNDANMTQAEFEGHLKNIKAYYSSSTAAVKQSTAVAKEAAKAEKELNTNLRASEKTREAITAAVERYKKAESSSNANVRQSYSSIQALTGKLKDLKTRYANGEISAEQFKEGVASVNAELRASTRSLDEAGYGVDGLSTRFARLTQELGRFLSPFLLARQAWQTIKQMANVVIELEDAFAQLQIVTGATDRELEEFYSTASNIATNLGKSITDIAKSIEVFSRLGYSLPDATVLAEYATMLSNVASVTTDQATTGLTSIIKGYNMHVEDAEHVSDVLVSIGQKYAVSAGEMMEAYEKAGAALAATNTSFDKSAALIAAANAAVQNSSIVGTALKTVSARIRGSKSDLQELGEDVEEVADGFSKYAKELKALTGVNIMVEGTTNQFKDLYDIMDEIAGVWGNLTDTQQARTAEILGGTRQLQVIASIINNWKDAEGAYVDAQNSAGEAARANSIYMDTATAHMNQFKAAFQELSHTIIDSDFLKAIIDIGTSLLKAADAITKFTQSAGGLTSLLMSLSGLVLLFKGGEVVKLLGVLSNSIGKGLTSAVGSVVNGFTALKTLGDGFVSTLDVVTVNTNAAATATSAMAGAWGIVAVAAGAVIGIIAKIRSEREKEREETIKLGEKAAETDQEVLDLVKDYENLKKTSTSIDEIVAARNDVIAKLREEGVVVDDLSGKYDNYVEAASKVFDRNRANIGNAIDAARDDLAEKNYGGYKDVNRISWGAGEADANIAALKTIKDYLRGSYTDGNSATLQIDFGEGGAEGALQAYNNLNAAMEALIRSGNTTNSVYRELSRQYDALSVGVDAYNGLVEKQIDNIASAQLLDAKTPETIDDYLKLRESIMATAAAQDKYGDSTISIGNAVDSFLSKQSGFEKFSAAVSGASQDILKEYDELMREVGQNNVDLSQTVFGNIDMNNRQQLEWTREKIKEYTDALKSWEIDIDDLLGSTSTVLGSSEEFDGVEIAFSPILQTENGPVLLNSQTVYDYIWGLIDAAGEGWHNEDLLRLDTTGLDIDGMHIQGLLADIGETAIHTGEAMHYVGEDGALAMVKNDLSAMAQELLSAAGYSDQLTEAVSRFSAVKGVFDDVTTALKGITDVQDLVANGFAVDVEKAMELASVYPQILDNATIAADGQLLLNEETLNSFIDGKQGEINSSIESQIAQLEGDKAVLEGKKELAIAQLNMAQQVAEGEAALTAEQLQNRLDNSNKVVQMLIEHGVDEAEAYKLVAKSMAENSDNFAGTAEEAFNTVAADAGLSFSSMATAADANTSKVNVGLNTIIDHAHQVAAAVSAAGSGEQAGSKLATGGGGAGSNINTFTGNLVKGTFKGVDVQFAPKSTTVSGIIKKLSTDIKGYTSAIGAINGQIAALNALRNKATNTINGYRPSSGSGSRGGSGGGGGGGGGGSGSSSSQKEETWFQKQYKLHQHYVNMDQETTADFLKWLEKAYKQAYKEGIITLDEYYKYEEEIYNGYNKIKEAAKSTFDALVDYRVKMLKQDRENQKSSINDQLNDLKDFYNKQKEMLQKQQDEEKYNDEQAEKRKSVNDIKQQIAQLQFDTSAWAQKRRQELLQELSDAEKDLQDFEDQHALEEALNALDEAYNAEEERLNKQIEAIDEVLNDPDALYNQALADIKGNTEDLFKAFILFNKKYGDGDDETIKKLWEEAFKNNEEYKKIVGKYYEDTKIGNYTGYKAPTPPTNPQPPTSSSSSSKSSSSSSSSSSKSSAPSLSSGSTVQVKTSATHFSPKSGSVRMASFVPGGQYTVYQTSGNEVLIGRGGVYTGWIYRSDIVGYKKGTKNATPGLHKVNEEGTEAIFSSGDGNQYRMFSGGEKVLNAKATNFLYEFAMAGAEILDKMRGASKDVFRGVGTINQPIDINMGDIIINGNIDKQSVSDIRRAQREQVNDVLKAFNKYQITLYRGVRK